MFLLRQETGTFYLHPFSFILFYPILLFFFSSLFISHVSLTDGDLEAVCLLSWYLLMRRKGILISLSSRQSRLHLSFSFSLPSFPPCNALTQLDMLTTLSLRLCPSSVSSKEDSTCLAWVFVQVNSLSSNSSNLSRSSNLFSLSLFFIYLNYLINFHSQLKTI